MSAPVSRRAWLARAAGAVAGSVAGAVVTAAAVPTAAAALVAGLQPGAPKGPRMTIYKSPNCGCCQKWVMHVAAAGFQPAVNDTDDLDAIKRRYGIPASLESCHTALVDGYLVEGHVPAADVKRLLKERPKVKGIAVPGMPAGSPGMEVPSGQVDRYEVVAFLADGSTRRFASH